jgi:predicted nucleotidyltransferase
MLVGVSAIPPKRRLIGADELAVLQRAVGCVTGADPRVVAAYLHGSAARGEAAADVDVAVLFDVDDEDPSASELEAMAARLEEEGAPAGMPVDLRSLSRASPRFCANVLRDARLLYERDRRDRVRAEAEIMARWGDFQPVWARMRERMRQRWARG